MNALTCPQCERPFSLTNQPRRLKNCGHSLCDQCLPSTFKCPLDNKRVEFRRYTPAGFPVDQQVLEQLQWREDEQQRGQSTSDDSKEDSPTHLATCLQQSGPRVQPEPQVDTCLLHSKPADLVCCLEGTLICASCALFGEHKGHPIQGCQQFLESLGKYTEQALEVFDQLKNKEEALNQGVVDEYLEECLKEQRAQQVKAIKQAFTKLMEKVRRAERAALASLDTHLKTVKEGLAKELSLAEMEGKKEEWYREVEQLGTIIEEAHRFHNLPSALKYFDDKEHESFLIKRGEYLSLEYTACESVLKTRIDQETARVVALFDSSMDKSLEGFCSFSMGTGISVNLQTPLGAHKDNSFEREGSGREKEEDILIDQSLQRGELEESALLMSKEPPRTDCFLVLPEISAIESARSSQGSSETCIFVGREPRCRSKSIRQKSGQDFLPKGLLGAPDKRKKKIEVPQKYRAVLEDLRNDRAEVIDFGGAEMGDANILALCEYIEKSSRLRNLKLVRNKISDDAVKELLNACFCSKVTSLNLGQNQLSERTLDMLEAFDLGELRNITLSLNKINRRNVKSRLEDFAKRGITLSV